MFWFPLLILSKGICQQELYPGGQVLVKPGGE